MGKSRVTVLCSHPLLGSGIVRLLSQDPGLEVTTVPSAVADGHAGLVLASEPDAIVVEVNDRAAEADRIVESLPPVTVVVVTLADNGMEVYRDRKRLPLQGDSLSDLLSRGLLAGTPGEAVPSQGDACVRAVGSWNPAPQAR